jgi:D-hydroxyproline dehydrogenase subunit beta
VALPVADTVVIGGGVMGAAAAYHLARAGTRVVVVERAGLAREASGANVGLVTLFSAYSLREPEPGVLHGLTRASMDTYAPLGDEVGIDIEYERGGGLVIAESEGELDALRPAYEGYRRRGVPVEWLEPAAARATRALARGAERHGARFLFATAVEAIACVRGRIAAVRTTAGKIACGAVVNAAGAWADAVGALAGVRVPVVPGRGQILLTEPAPRFITRVVSGVEPSARQTRRGNVIIGSTVEAAGFDRRVTLPTLHDFARAIVPRFPALRRLRVLRSWAGLRPMTPDDRPILERRAEPAGLCLAVGLGRRGVSYAGGAGLVVSELVTGKPPSLPIDGLGLDRFGARAATA